MHYTKQNLTQVQQTFFYVTSFYSFDQLRLIKSNENRSRIRESVPLTYVHYKKPNRADILHGKVIKVAK